MPLINIQLTHEISPHQASQLAAGATKIMESILGKKPELTAVNISVLEPKHWFIGNNKLSDTSDFSAQVIAKISENTNTEEQKAQAIDAFHELLDEHYGPINEVSYVQLDEIPTTDWGYGGKTQEERRIKRASDGSVDTNYYLQKGKYLRSGLAWEYLAKLKSVFSRA